MSRRNVFQDPSPDQVEPALGMDTTSPLQAVPVGYVRSARNARPGLVSGYTKRLGYSSSLTSNWDTRSITAGIEYQKADGALLTYLFGTDGSGAGGNIGYVDSGAVTSVVTGLSGTARGSFVQFNNLLFYFNGSDAPVVIADTTSRQMGITAPVSAPTSSQTTTGNLVQTATYLYAYTYYNSVTGAESSPSPILSVTLAGSEDQVDLTLVAGSSSTADTIRVYRSYANGNQLFLEGTNAINDTTYSSTAADSALETTLLELDNTRVTTWSGTPQYPCVAGQRIWLKTGTNEIRCSKLGQSGPMPESFPVTNVIDCNGTYGAADDVIGIAKAGDRVIVLKERSVGTIDQIGYQDPSRAEETVLFVYRELTTSVFPASHWAAVELSDRCIFLAKDNVYATNGEPGSVMPVADPIAATIMSLGFTAAQCVKLSAANDAAQKEIRFQVFADENATTPAYCLVGNYANAKAGIRWTWDTPGDDAGTHPGIKAACYFTKLDSTTGAANVYFGGFSNGKLYKANDGTSDDGDGIFFELVDRPRSAGASMADKLWQLGGFFCSGSGADYEVEVASIYDLSGAEEDVKQISLASGGVLWDDIDAEWDAVFWGSNSSPRRKYHTHRKAQHRQLVFRQADADAPVTLFSWTNIGSFFRLY